MYFYLILRGYFANETLLAAKLDKFWFKNQLFSKVLEYFYKQQTLYLVFRSGAFKCVAILGFILSKKTYKPTDSNVSLSSINKFWKLL